MKFLIIMLFLLGCSKTSPTTAIGDSVKQEIINIKKEINNSQCDEIAKQKLNQRMDEIKSHVDNMILTCNTEKQVYKQEISKLKIVILGLILTIGFSTYIIYKRN